MAGKENIEIGHLNEGAIVKSEVVVPSELTGAVSFSNIKTKVQAKDWPIILNQDFSLATIYGQSFLLQLKICDYDPDEGDGGIKITLQGAQKIVKIHELKFRLDSNRAHVHVNYDMQEKIKNEKERFVEDE